MMHTYNVPNQNMGCITYLPGVLGEAPLVGLEDLLASGELELGTPERLDGGRAVVVLRPDGDDDLKNQPTLGGGGQPGTRLVRTTV